MKLSSWLKYCSGVSAAALWTLAPAQAQQAADAQPQAQPDAADGGDIIVTAQKRAERLSDVPVSVTAASGAQLASQGVASVEQLEKIVPGFTYQATPLGIPIFTIRGVGFFDQTSVGGAPAVGIYLDQVSLPYSVMARGATLDLERVEALKGPQGTLFGQSTTGGAINYVAAKPTEDLHAGFDLSYGRFNAITAGGFVSGQIAPTLTMRVAGRYEYQDGWQKQYLPFNAKFGATGNDRLGARRFFTGRMLLDWKPSDSAKFELSVNGWQDGSDTQALRAIQFNPKSPADPFNAAAYTALSSLTEYPRKARIAGWNQNLDYGRDDDFYQVALRGDVELGDVATLTSISAYARYREQSLSDADGTGYTDLSNHRVAKIESLSQELRLAGDAGGVRWMIGGSYADDMSDEVSIGDNLGTNNGVGPIRYTGTLNLNRQDIKTYAAFGSLDYRLTDTITAQGSARYTSQKRDYRGCTADPGDGSFANLFVLAFGLPAVAGKCITQVAPPPAVPALLPIVTSKLDEDNVSFRGSLNWKPNNDLMVYGSIAKGYKPGSFPAVPAIYAQQLAAVTQESVIAYESGVKVALADRRVQLTAAGFYYDYRNKQLQGVGLFPIFGTLPQLVNIPKSRVVGAEMEITARPVDGLRFSGGLTYVDSKVKTDPANPRDAFGTPTSFVGEAFPSTPKWQGVADAEYRFAVGDGGNELYFGTSLTARSSSYAIFGENPQLKIKGYALVDLRAGIEGDNGVWRAELWGRNVTNHFYQTGITNTVDTLVGVAGMPATYGLRFSYRY